MKIVHLDTTGEFAPPLQQRLKQVADYHVHIQPNINDTVALQHLKNADIAILSPSAIKPVTAALLKKLPQLKHIALVTSGYEWVDIETCKELIITISRPIGANSQAVAEHTLGLMIDLAKRITEFDRDVRTVHAYDFRNYTGTELYGKTLGIIGLGNIGHRLRKLVSGFDMKVLAYDRSEATNSNYQVVSLGKLLKESDFITINIPLTPETTNLIGDAELALVKKGCIIVNTARELIVNKSAIIDAVKSGQITGYGIETEIMKPISSNDAYLQYPNIIVNVHNAFNTSETQKRTDKMVVNNVLSFIQGKPTNLL